MKYLYTTLFLVARFLFPDEDVFPPIPLCKDESEEYCCPYPMQDADILVPRARGLIVANTNEEVDPADVSGVVFSGLPTSKKLQNTLADLVIDKPVTNCTIEEIKREIHQHYQAQGYPFVQVFLPEQDVTDGVLKVVALESRLGNIEVRENHWYQSSMFEKAISVKQDEVINLNLIAQDLNFLNKSPFMRVDAIYAPGDEPNTTDLILKVKDICPFRVSGGVDNAGLEATDRGRGFTSVEYGKMWGLNHTLNLGFVSSLDSSKFRGYTAQYVALLSWHHILTVYGGYSHVHKVRLEFPSMENHGNSYQGSLRYAIPLRPLGPVNQEITFGADWKRTNNTILFSALFENFGKNANLTQAAFRYDGNFEWSRFRMDWNAEAFWSPGEIVSDQSNADYESLRPGAKNKYLYGTGSVRLVQWMPGDLAIMLWLRGQLSSQNLLPSEQIGIGGFDTVRGYEERQLNTDAGFIMNAEIRSPFFRLHPKSWGRRGYSEGLQLLVFMDYGYGRNHTPIPNEGKSQFLLGAGPGARYSIDPWMNARLDWGFKWHSSDLFGFGGSMIHFSVNISL